jgi:general secretion pathway protein D
LDKNDATKGEHCDMKARTTIAAAALFAALFISALTIPARAADPAPADSGSLSAASDAAWNNVLDDIDLRDVPLRDALTLIGRAANLNLTATNEAAKTQVTLRLDNVSAYDAVQALCQTHGLFFKKPTDGSISIVTTVKEFQEGLTVFREEKTAVFTLLYPNAMDLAVAIRDLYGNRVQLSLGKESVYDESNELSKRLSTFDQINSRGQSFSNAVTGGNNNSSNGSSSSANSTNSGSTNLNGFSQQGVTQQPSGPQDIKDLTADQLTRLSNQLHQQGAGLGVNAEALSSLGQNSTPIYVTVVNRNNQVVVRTSDPGVLDEITSLKSKIDVPTPQVLLEVKVLSVDLTDGFNSVFDYQFGDQHNTTGFSSGDIGAPTAPSLTIGGSGEGSAPGAMNTTSLVYQWVSDNFRTRVQLLESHNKVTELASPLLLVANNEVSQVFVGRQIPIVQGYSAGSATAGTNGSQSIITPPSPQTALQQVGTSLLITPNINADRTVTLRLVQEQSSVVPGGATIPVVVTTSSGNSLTSTINDLPIDVVSATTLSGTLVAKDGLSLALGGLIDETVTDQREEVPILGQLPLLGVLFRRQSTGRTRSEVIVVIRPYVLSTPSEAEEAGKRIVQASSLHPKAPALFPPTSQPIGTMNTFTPDEVLRPNPPHNELENIFRFHSVLPTDY